MVAENLLRDRLSKVEQGLPAAEMKKLKYEDIRGSLILHQSLWRNAYFSSKTLICKGDFKHLAGMWLVATACDSRRLLPHSGITWKTVALRAGHSPLCSRLTRILRRLRVSKLQV